MTLGKETEIKKKKVSRRVRRGAEIGIKKKELHEVNEAGTAR